MTVVEQLKHLRSLGVEFRVVNGRLSCDSPKGVLTPELRTEITSRKSEIIEFLERGQAAIHEISMHASNHSTGDIIPLDRSSLNDLPLSYAQERLWLLTQFTPPSGVYNMGICFRFLTSIDTMILGRALDTLLTRHEILRTFFISHEGQPRAVVKEGLRGQLEIEMIPDGFDAEARAAERANQIAGEPLDLEHGPLLRVSLLKLNSGISFLVLVAHHIIMDGWSLRLIERELAILYDAYSQGESSPLPELPVQYVDYALWQREQMKKGDYDDQLNFWISRLAGELPVLDIPSDHPRPSVSTYRGSVVKYRPDPSITPSLRQLARSANATEYMLLLAAFQVLLGRLSATTDIIVGTPIADRRSSQTEGVVGLFLNMLPMRGDLSKSQSFREYLVQVRRESLAAYAHQDVPFEQLIQAISPPREVNRHPVYQAMFAFQNQPVLELQMGAAIGQPVLLCPGWSQLDLSLYMWEEKGVLTGCFEYSRDLFNQETIEHLAKRFDCLLQAIIDNPELSIAHLPIMDQEEYEAECISWNRTARNYTNVGQVVDLIEEQAQRHPERLAVMDKSLSLCYGDLMERAQSLAQHLLRGGFSQGALVGIYSDPSAMSVVGLLAVHLAGGAYVPLSPSYPHERLDYMIEDSGLEWILADPSRMDSVPGHGTRVIGLGGTASEKGPVIALPEPRGADSPAYVIYTSGSTGRPKGVAVPHGALTNFLLSMTETPGISSEDVLLSVTPLSFDISGLELFLPLTVGARVVVADHEDTSSGKALMRLITSSGATVLQGTPATWRLLLETGWRDGSRLKVLCGGEVLHRDLADQILATGAELWNMYGPTETTIWSAVDRVEPGPQAPPIGLPIANTQFYLLSPDNEPVPLGVVGELLIGGSGLALGYMGQEELTVDRFIPNPLPGTPGERLYRTGDRMVRLPDGRLEFRGRLDNQVKIRGFRIELGEIETVLERYEGIIEAVTTTRVDSSGDGQLVAHIRTEGVAPSVEALKEYLSLNLPDYMIPSFIMFLEVFPLTPSGKVDRKALPEPQTSCDGPLVPPRTQTERCLVGIWQRLLNRQGISVHDNFFDQGGHSLLAARMFAFVEKELNKQVSPALLFQAPTVARLAEVIDQMDFDLTWSCLVPIKQGENRSPLFLIHGAEGNVLLYRNLAQHLDPEQPVYGLQSEGLNPAIDYDPSIEKLASRYISEIQSIQPKGPYYLGGYCLGGTIAFEMARQLHSQGERVALVAMMETYNAWSSSNRSSFFYDRIYSLQNVIFHIQNLFILKSNERRAFFKQKLKVELSRMRVRIEHNTARLCKRFGMSKGLIYQHIRIDQANDAALAAYEPIIYPGRVMIFKPMKGFLGYNDPAMGWSGFAEEGVDIKEIQCNPRSMLVEPFVRELASELSRLIKESTVVPTANTIRVEKTGL